MIKKFNNEIVVAIFIAGFAVAFYFLYGLILPVFIGLFLAFKCLPIIVFIQKFVKNRNLATSFFLLGLIGILILSFVFLSNYINKDFKRLQNSFYVLTSQNKSTLDNVGQKVKEYVGKIYNVEDLETKLKMQTDSLQTKTEGNESEIDFKAIEDAYNSIVSVFEKEPKTETAKKSGFSLVFIIFSSLLYFVLILFNLDYFIGLKNKYLIGKVDSKFQIIINDFNQSFVKYFVLRTKIVLILSIIYLTTFIILDLPGCILFTFLIVLLSYIPYIQYIMLIPISIACLVLSIENNHDFLFYFGIVSGSFVLASLIEEMVLNTYIMEKNIGLNTVFMVLGAMAWSYLLGVLGIFIGIPLTSLIIIYIKRYFLESYLKINEK